MPFSPEELETRRGESRVPMAVATMVAMPALALVFTVLRLYVRRFLVKIVHPEDYAIIGAMVSSIAMSVCMGISSANGTGRHVETIRPEQVIVTKKVLIGISTTYLTVHMLVKLSILLQYLRISVMRFERVLCYGLLAVLVTAWVVMFIMGFLMCIPLSALWEPNTPGARCLNSTSTYYMALIYNMVMDFLILIAPAFILRHLTVPWYQRVLLGIVLAFGALACIVSALRLQTIYATTTSKDKSWDGVPSGMYGTVEVNLGIICTSVVALRPLFHKLRRFLPGGGAPPDERPAGGPMGPRPPRKIILPDDLPSFGSNSTHVVNGGVELDTVNKEELSRARSAATSSSSAKILKGNGDRDLEIGTTH